MPPSSSQVHFTEYSFLRFLGKSTKNPSTEQKNLFKHASWLRQFTNVKGDVLLCGTITYDLFWHVQIGIARKKTRAVRSDAGFSVDNEESFIPWFGCFHLWKKVTCYRAARWRKTFFSQMCIGAAKYFCIVAQMNGTIMLLQGLILGLNGAFHILPFVYFLHLRKKN